MKNKLSRKFIIGNLIIVVASLLIFCAFVIRIFTNYMYDSMEEQLLVENNTVARMQQVRNLFSNERNGASNVAMEGDLYQSLIDSIDIIYMRNHLEMEYTIDSTTDESFNFPYDVEEVLNLQAETEKQIIILDIDGIEYMVTAKEVPSRREFASETIVVSLLALESVSQVINTYIWGFIIASILLVSIGSLVTVLISRRITKPIHKLTKLTRSYANRDFSEQYIAETGDEIQDLSEAVSEMANSLQRYNEERDKLFRHISHELKTPLTAIYGYAEGIKNGVFDKDDEALEIIMSESFRIKKLTEDLILLSKLESNVEQFNFEEHSIIKTVIKSIQSVESLAILKDIDIIYEPVSIAKFCYDEDKIHRALVNILGNCIKYTRDMISIEIKERKTGLHEVVEILIKDNGNGFDTEALDRLLNGMTKEKNNGSGIGLSIVSEIMKAHGGKLSLGNNLEGGAVFRLQLNLKKS